MQENAPAIPQWLLQVLQNLAWFGAGGLIIRVITLWLNRKKPAVEIQKTEAEATEITIRTKSVAGDSLDRMIARLDRSVAQNESLRSRNADLQEKCDKLEMETESYDRQMRKMKAFMTLHNLKYSDMDYDDTKRVE
jgi:cell division protein FtsB